MYKTFRQIGSLLTVVVIASAIFVTCSKDDGPTNPGNGNNNNTTITDTIRPIVFVHGRLGAADSWTSMIQRFRFIGNNYPRNYMHPIDFTEYYGASFSSYDIIKMAKQLQSFVNAVIQQTGWSRVDIVAHDIGVQAVQYYLTKLDGVNKIAHFVASGGIIDNSLTLNGSLTPTPVKYMTIYSNGNDATQNGDATKGSLTGANNQQLGGLDHQEIINHILVFKTIYSFFTGKQPLKLEWSLTTNNTISGKVVNFIDNTPIQGAQVTLHNINSLTGLRQYGGYPAGTTDVDGNWGPITIQHTQFLEMYVTADGYHDMHLYRQQFRDSTFTERIRMIPKSGGIGSSLLQSFASTITVGPNHSVVILYSPQHAIYFDQDSAKISNVIITNVQTAPPVNSSSQGSNTMWIVCFDDKADQTTTTGPLSNPLLNTYGINSFDLYIQAVTAGQSVNTTFDSQQLNLANWRSAGTLPGNSGIGVVQYDSN